MAKAKPGKKARRGPVLCPACGVEYPPSALVRRTVVFPGRARSSGGPTGARSTYLECCPKGHEVRWLGYRVS